MTNKRGIDNLSEQIMILGARIYPLFRRVFQDYHPDEIAVLHILRARDGELKRRELIKSLCIDEGVVSKRIRDLLKRGLVDSCRSPSSARESIDKITAKGNREVEEIRNKMKLLLKQGFAFIDKEEQKVLGDVVKEANSKIKTIESIVTQVINSI